MCRQSVQRERNRVPFESASVRRVLPPLIWCWWTLAGGDAQWIYVPVCASTFYAYFAASASLKSFSINRHRAPLHCNMHRSTAIGNPSQVKAKGGQRSQQASMILGTSAMFCTLMRTEKACTVQLHGNAEGLHLFGRHGCTGCSACVEKLACCCAGLQCCLKAIVHNYVCP